MQANTRVLAVMVCIIALVISAVVLFALLGGDEQGGTDRQRAADLGTPAEASHLHSLDGVAEAGEDQRETVAVDDDLQAPAEVAEVAEPRLSKESFLEEFWGEEWPLYREQILAMGGDFGTLIDPSSVRPWEEVEPELREFALRDEEHLLEHRQKADLAQVTAEELQALYSGPDEWSDEILAKMNDVVASHAPAINEAIIRAANEEYRYRQQLWQDGRYAVGPLFAVGGPDFIRSDTPGVGADLTLYTGGWSLRIRLSGEDNPFWGDAISHLFDLQDARMQALMAVR